MSIELNANYYDRVLRDNGYESLRDQVKPIDFSLGQLTSGDLSLSWFCHHEADEFATHALATRERVKVVTGIGLSGTPHLGTLSQMLKAIRLQRYGDLAVKFVLGDLDAYNGKNTPLQYARALGEQVREFMLRLGFDDSGRNELQGQYDELDILRTMYLSGLFMEDADLNAAEEDLHSFYVGKGKVDDKMSFRRKLSLALMVAGWIHQQIEKGDKDLLITLGIDEHQYVRFGQQVLRNMQSRGEFTSALEGAHISAMYSTLIRGFNGYPKMSKSFPDSGIHLGMSHQDIQRLIMTGEGSYETPEDNVVFQCMASASTYSPSEVEERYKLCQGGGESWKEARRDYVEHLFSMVKTWQDVPTHSTL